MSKLTAKQQAFLEAICSGLGPSNSYRKAYKTGGMNDASIRREAQSLLKHPSLAPIIERHRAELEERTRKAAEKAGVTREWLIERYRAIAGFDIGDLAEWDESGNVIFKNSAGLTPEQRLAIQSVSLEVSPKGAKSAKLTLASKLAALDSLSKILGLFRPESEGTGDASLNLKIIITPPNKDGAANRP